MKVEPILKSAAVRSRGASLILVFPTIFLIPIAVLFRIFHLALSTFHANIFFYFPRCKLHLCDNGHLASSSPALCYSIGPFKRCSRHGGL